MPVPCERRSTGQRDRMAKRTLGQPRWRRPTPYRRGSPDTPSPRGWTSPDHDPCANPDLRSSVAYGIRLDQARIDRKAFAANTGRDARLDDPLEHVAENISIAETLVASARKCRMIRDGVLDSELAEPAIGQVSPALHGRSVAPSGSQTRTPRPASGSSVLDRSTGDPSANSEVQVRCEAKTDREQHRSSAPGDPQGPRRQDETRRTVDLGHSSDGPSWIDLAEIRV